MLCLPEQTALLAVYVPTTSDPKAVLTVNPSAAEDPSHTSRATVSDLVEADRNPIRYAGLEGRHKDGGR